MAKNKILSDSFEQLAELGKSTAKQGSKQIGQTFSPMNLLDNLSGKNNQENLSDSKNTSDKKTEIAKNEGKNTPLNLDQLQKKYQNPENIKMEALRNRLFRMVKQEEEKSLEREKAKKQQQLQKEEAEKEEKKRQKIKKQQLTQSQEEPKGKIRQSIFSPRKIAQRSQAEVRPASGKQ